MRKLNPKGITFDRFEYKEPKEINFGSLEADITVLAHQPGIGKTYSVIKYMEKEPHSFYLTDRHSTLEEIAGKNKARGIVFSHWEGFKRKCSNEEFKNLDGISPTLLCELCNRNKKCGYPTQFNNNRRVLAPYDYLGTPYILNPNPPKIVFLDENKTSTVPLSFNKRKFLKWLGDIGLNSRYITAVEEENYGFFTRGRWKTVRKNYEGAVIGAIKEGDMERVGELSEINPAKIEEYFIWGRKYGNYTRNYYVPLYYYAFDLVSKGIPIVFLDATFYLPFFRYLIEAYNGEMGFNKKIRVKIFMSNKENKKTRVYALQQGYHPEVSFTKYWGHTKKWLIPHLERIKHIFGSGNVGVVGHKKLFGDDIEIHLREPRENKMRKKENKVEEGEKIYENNNYRGLFIPILESEYFGNLRSSNKLEDRKVLVIAGTYTPSSEVIREEAEKLFDLDKPIISELFKALEEAYRLEDIEVAKRHGLDRLNPRIFEELNNKRYVGYYDKKKLLPPYGENLFFSPHLIILGERKSRIKIKDIKESIERSIESDEVGELGLLEVSSCLKYLVWDSELYQAYHRNRGLRKDRIIISYGIVPHEIYAEFDVIEIKSRRELEREFSKLEEEEKKNRVIEKIIRDIANGESNTDIARTYKIWIKGEGVNTKDVRALREAIERIKEDIRKNK